MEQFNAPTLVMHGTADPIIPVEHGRKLVETIPNATGVWLDGVGPVFPVPNMEAVMKQILTHLENSKQDRYEVQ
jgi:pimeloyl-ACP methyl ester carboxylesterase